MKFSLSFSALALTSVAVPALGANYLLTDNIIGADFLAAFNFEAEADPTNGRVNYVNRSTALRDDLVSSTFTTFKMRADDKTVLNATGPGRNSVRIRSNKKYSTHVAIFNVNHMPQGCGTWPAIWETKETNWPNGGEVDILEGVNDQGPNEVTLHTAANCTMPSTGRYQTGTVISTDCVAADNFNAGCAVGMDTNSSYGPRFNDIGGGWYAVERTSYFISVWFWARTDDSVPLDVSYPTLIINTDKWGTPSASFPNTDCDIASEFDPNNIIINLTFCGDRAGNADIYAASGCPSTCVDYVNNNPSAFSNAFFEFAGLQIYQ